MLCRQWGGTLLLINCNPPVKVGAGLPARCEALAQSVLTDADQQAMFTWFTQLPAHQADFDLTRRLAPDVKDFRAWLAALLH